MTASLKSRGSVLSAALTLGVFLLATLPLFVCLPPWADVTLYDLAARNLLQGGVHYRDIFDTNLPGMVWLHAGIRAALGWRSEVLRAVDVAVVATAISLLVVLLPLSLAGRLWTALALSGLYLATTEAGHCQRDVWMLLPALLAVHCRRQRLTEETLPGPCRYRFLALAAVEGLCWGVAFWIKPFVVVPALACCLAVCRLQRDRRRLVAEAFGLIAGGGVAVAVGVIWLATSGSWPYFYDILVQWNPEYLRHGLRWRQRLLTTLNCPAPWGLAHLLAAPRAISLLGGVNLNLRLLAGCYLGWLAQALCWQQLHEYVLVPAALLAVALVAGGLTASARWQLPVLLPLAVFLLLQQPLLQTQRLACWARCWREGSTAELRNRLRLTGDPYSVDWHSLQQVADFLRTQGLRDGELTCYNNFTHPLLLDLGLRPSTPFLHFDTILHAFPSRRQEIQRRLAVSRQRLVVGDLLAVAPGQALAEGPSEGLPPGFPAAWADRFPWTEAVVFRAGRYTVHQVCGPVAPLFPEVKQRSRRGEP